MEKSKSFRFRQLIKEKILIHSTLFLTRRMMFFRQAHQEFCNYKIVFENLSPRTIQWYKHNTENYLNFSEIEHLEEFTKQSVERWIIHNKTHRNWAPKTIRNALMTMTAFGNWCVTNKYFAENPAKNIPKPKLPKRLPKHLTREQAQILLDWTMAYRYTYTYEKPRAVAIIAMFLHTGVRHQELINLKLCDVNLESNVIHVISGKGDKDRVIPISGKLHKVLKEYLKFREKINDESPYFFVNKISSNKLSSMVIKRLFAKLRVKTKFHFHSHLLRHTFATLMLQGGCDVFSLSKMLGHSSITTTTIYLSATTHHLKDQIVKHPLNF
jgi:site-specific recombinase XerD